METKLARIAQLSKENPDMVFTSVGHLINKEMLKDCHDKMDGDKAVGIDGITREEYARNLDENLDALVESLKKLNRECDVTISMNCPYVCNNVVGDRIKQWKMNGWKTANSGDR